MSLLKRLASGAAVTTLVLAAASAVYAQETTSAIRGQVSDEAGAPLAGATITILHEPSGSTATAVTDSDGGYDVRNLRPGGPYLITATVAGHEGKKVRVPALGLGSATSLNIELAGGNAVSELVVTATPKGIKEVTTGPVTSFTSADIETLPSFSRDLKDLVRLNPFVTLDPTNASALLVAGASNRVNTIYVDGVKQADDFGINQNGYPSQRSPISNDWVQAFNFEVAPYDVQYGEFQGGVLNLVTKSGSNQLHAMAFTEYDGDKYAGRSYRGINNPTFVPQKKFYDRTYGFYVNGPIIPGKLFFFGGYEKYETAAVANTFGPGDDASVGNHVTDLTTAQVSQITSILKTKYNFNPLGYVSGALPQSDRKYFARFDWNVTDRQRLMVSYQEDDGVTLSNGGSNSTTNLALLSQYYNLNQTLKVWNVQATSQWTDAFSTEFAFNRKEVASIRAPLAGSTFAQFQIRMDPVGTPLRAPATVTLGPDISSQANVLQNTDELFRFRAHYKLGAHTFTAGYEHEHLSVFNLFDQNANGAYVFSSACGSGNVFTNLQNGVACSLTYANAATNVKADAAANWQNVTNIAYVQDEWEVTPQLTLRAGLRAEWYTDSTVPQNNPRFMAQYGFANTSTYDGAHVIMPRVGFNWRPDNTLTVSGGFGLFSGGNPNVWLSNSYTNTGRLIGSASFNCSTAICSPALTNVSGTDVGSTAKTTNTNSANLGTGITNAVAPNFAPPSTWKASISVVKLFDVPYFGSDWRVHGDFLYEQVKDGITWVDLYAQANRLGVSPDGRPTYKNTRFAVAGTAPYDLLMTNDHIGRGRIWALGFGKSWREGYFDGFDFDITYTRQHVTEANPGTSSVALSNYSQWAITDRNSPEQGTSNYQIKYQTKVQLNYQHAFFGDYKTSIRLYGQRRAGLPFSYTFRDASTTSTPTLGEQMFGETQAAATRNTQLLYVPQVDSTGHVTATSDSRVTYNTAGATPFNVADFDQYLHSTGLIKYAGQIAPRNVFKSRDVTTIDLRLEQELPAFIPHGSRFKAYMDIINLGNLLNRKWGVLEQYSFPGAVAAVTAVNCQANAPTPGSCLAGPGNYYQYNTLTKATPTLSSFSNWTMKFGIRYEF